MVFHWSLSDSKCPQVSRIFLRIMIDINNAVVWMIFARIFISDSAIICTNRLVTVPSTPITIGITITFMLYSFVFSSLPKSKYISLFGFPSILLCGLCRRWSPHFCKFYFLLTIKRSRLGDLFVCQNFREFCVSRSLRRILGCTYTTCSHGRI